MGATKTHRSLIDLPKYNTMKEQRLKISIFLSLFLTAFLAVLVSGCMSSKSSPHQLEAYYSSHYPEEQVRKPNDRTESKSLKKAKSGSGFWKSSSAKPPLDLESIELKQEDQQAEPEIHAVTAQGGKRHEILIPPVNRYAADDDISQNTASMIEGKIFNLVEDAYRKRDYNEFIKLYSLFVESFPHSSQKSFLDEKRRDFFYRENLQIEKLRGAMLELSYPNAKSLDELNNYFERLKENGISSIQVDVVQFLGEPVFLFANPKKGEGYYFSNSHNLIVDDLLSRITKMAHSNDLKVFASFPLRHHPRLGDNSEFLMDESWNAFQNRTSINPKLDLLNPASRAYLMNLLKELLLLDVDGIVFRDDFTYERTEGFSMVAMNRYQTETGQPISFNSMFVPVRTGHSGEFEMLTGDEFQNVALWRTREITQLLWDLISFVKTNRSDLFVGLEVTPEMLLDQYDPMKWYSTGMHYLKDLNVDSFVLKWRKYKSENESDEKDYSLAVRQLREQISPQKEIYLKIPLSQITKNTIELNRKIDTHNEFQNEFSSIKIAIGPVDRTKRLDIVN